MGPDMTEPLDLKPVDPTAIAGASKARPKIRVPPPQALSDVALVDAIDCAAAGAMGVSWWHAEVAAGRAPQPVIREPRCTRWRLADVRAYWLARAEKATCSAHESQTVVIAKKASLAAQAKRSSRLLQHSAQASSTASVEA